MKNPINNRLPRLFIKQPGRYLPIFILLLITIVIISAFFIVQGSVEKIYYDYLEESKIEDGNFTVIQELSDERKNRLKAMGFEIYENFYTDVDYRKTTISTHKIRTEFNEAKLIEGRLPEKEDEIALDYNYARNNELKLHSHLFLENGKFKLVGYVVIPDFIAMIKNRNDLVMDTINFGAALVTDEGFENIASNAVQFKYSYHYRDELSTKREAYDKLKELGKEVMKDNILTDAQTRAQNKRISFLIDDMGGDVPMITTLLSIIMVALAFVFTVQTKNLIEEEASVIGTLMATGYKKSELIFHYMLFPGLTVLLSAILANAATYAKLYNIFTSLYYDAFSLPPFIPHFNMRAFVLTTVIPATIIVSINLMMLINKLSISPLRFLRNELTKKRNKKRLNLPDIAFLRRFRLKVLFDNKLSVFSLLVGVTIANILLCFGLGFKPIFDNHVENIKLERPSQYQTYVRGIDNLDEEKFAASGFEITIGENTHPFVLYGISKESSYYDASMIDSLSKNEIMASEGLLKKFDLRVGDEIRLNNPYTDEEYKVKIKSSYEKGVSLAAFMPIEKFNELLGYDKDYFSGYFSNKKLDIEERFVIASIDKELIDKAMAHFVKTFGAIRVPITVVALIFYLVFMYLLSKMIIEKNRTPISYLKIFGFTDRENASIYLNATGLVLTIYLLLSPFILQRLMVVIMKESMKKFDAYMAPYMPMHIYIIVSLTGIFLFFLIQKVQTRKIAGINMVEALKDVTG